MAYSYYRRTLAVCAAFISLLCQPMLSYAGATGIHAHPLEEDSQDDGAEGQAQSGAEEESAADLSEELSAKWMRDDLGWWYRMPREDLSVGASWPVSEWMEIDGERYYFDENGYMAVGWHTENGVQYYLDPESGAMYHDRAAVIDGVEYNFNALGAAARPWPWKSPVVIPPEDQKSDLHRAMDSLCDNVLMQITNNAMSDRQKIAAICSYMASTFRYAGASATRDWVTEAYQGLRRHHGDCYTYFAVCQALLTRAGYPSIEVIRYTDNGHYWNLTQVDGNWYHVDTTPRSWRRSFCLLTDAEMLSLSAAHGGCFAFDRSLYPPTP